MGDRRGGGGSLFELDEVGAGEMDGFTAFLPHPPWPSPPSSMIPKQEQEEQEEEQEEHEEEEEEEAALEMPPGFRFKPTDSEVIYYLEEKCANGRFRARAIAEIDINKCEPWELPSRAKMGEKEWYFFWEREHKYPTGSRTNRATASGYWKATGKDKEIYRRVDKAGPGSSSGSPARCLVGMKKTLVFYKGRAPKGTKSNWVMHEYRRMPYGHSQAQHATSANGKKDWVVCRVFHKITPDASSTASHNSSDGQSPHQEPRPQRPTQPPPTTNNYSPTYPNYPSFSPAAMLAAPSNLPPLLDVCPSLRTPITTTSTVLAPSPTLYQYGPTPPVLQQPLYLPAAPGLDVHPMMPSGARRPPITASAAGALLRGKCQAEELHEYVTALRAAAAPSPSYQMAPPLHDPGPGTSGSAGGYGGGGGACSPCSSSDGPLAGLENMWDDY